MSNTGSNCRPFSLAKFDGRTRKGKFLREVRNGLADQLGGAPSAWQWPMVETAARLTTFIEELDAKLADGGALTDSEASSYAVWSAALARTLRDLRLQGVAARPLDGPGAAEAAA